MAFLALLLAINAAWLAYDDQAYPPQGQMVQVTLDGTQWKPFLHIQCVGTGNATPHTVVLFAGAGAPGIAMLGVADGLAARGFRACVYDRLGLGWSDDAIVPYPEEQEHRIVMQLLAAYGEQPPYIVGGHSAGGQLALMFAALRPLETAGLIMMDSVSSTAIGIDMKLIKVDPTTNSTNAATLTSSPEYNPVVTSVINIVRALTPLCITRVIHAYQPGYKYAAELAALYQNNKEWQQQWAAYSAMKTFNPDKVLTRLSERAPTFFGTGWPNFGAMPVLLMPANNTLVGGQDNVVCDITQTSCTQRIMDTPVGTSTYAKLYVTYYNTLSTNTSWAVSPIAHGFPQDEPEWTAQQIANKFTAV